MSFRKDGYVRGGLTVGGYSVAKYVNIKTGERKMSLMRNGRAVGSKTFKDMGEHAAWYTSTVPAGTDGHDTIVKLTEALR